MHPIFITSLQRASAGVLPCRVLNRFSVLLALACIQIDDPATWNRQYKDRAAATVADQLEQPSRAVFRYRAAIAGLLQLQPGMTAADIGAGSGFLARALARQVGATGRVLASESDAKMRAYIEDRARAEGLANITAVPATASSTGLGPASVDAAALVHALGTAAEPRALIPSVAAAVKPGGTLLVVDLPREGSGATAAGIDSEDVVALFAAAGFERVAESTVVPGEYAIRFRRRPDENWPGFRGPSMSGVAASAKIPDSWSPSEHVQWTAPIPGHGWSSPIVWRDTVIVTSAISAKPFKQPSTGLFGNDYIAELQAQGLSGDEIMKRVQARDNELPDEAVEVRYMIYALDAKTGAVKWEREALKAKPTFGRHRKNTYASETPFTDGERIYASFGANVGLFCYAMDGTLLWKKQWAPSPIYLDFGTASSPAVADGRVYVLNDNETESFITALDAKTGQELWRTPRPSTGFPKSSWMTPFVWKHALRTEIVTTGHGLVISYDTDGKELWRAGGMSMPTASPLAYDGWLYVGTGSQGDANRPLFAIKPGASGDISLAPGARSNEFIAWSHPRASGYTPSPLLHDGRVYLVHDTGILTVLDAKTGAQVYKVRVGGGGHTFSASPLLAGNRVVLLTEEGVAFVLEPGGEYKEIAKNDLGEMSLATPAVAGDALYLRTESKLYKIAR